ATPPATLRLRGERVTKMLPAVGDPHFARAHRRAFGQDRRTYEVVHIDNTADYNKSMVIQQEINIGIIEKLLENDIELA
ncbi:mechanosensitive ion channel family protein, partial [Salmonella enterica subsp. enterica serovar Infantis]